MRLHRGVGDLGGIVMFLADEGRIGEALRQVPELVVVLLLDVVWLALVDPISRRLHRLQRIEPRRERVIVHLNQLQSFLGDFGAGGSDRGDVVADVAHPIECKDTLVVPDGQDAVGIGRVAAGCDRFDARQRSAFEVLMARMRACACGECRILPKSIPGATRSSAYLPRPVTFPGASVMGSGLPITECGAMSQLPTGAVFAASRACARSIASFTDS